MNSAVMKFAILSLVSLLLGACGASHKGSGQFVASSLSVSPEVLKAFETTVYQFGVTQGCVRCHGTTVNPLWGTSDVSTAYTFARPLLDINNPTLSTLASRAGNNHCGDPVCANPANVAVMQDLLILWAAAEVVQSPVQPVNVGAALPNPPFFTTTIAMPVSIPQITVATPAVVRFNLSGLTPNVPALNGAILELSVQMYSEANTTYKFFNPRIVGASGPVTVSGLHIYLRAAAGSGIGVESANQGYLWSTLLAVAPVVAAPLTLPLGPITAAPPLTSISLSAAVQSTSDVITLGFLDIR